MASNNHIMASNSMSTCCYIINYNFEALHLHFNFKLSLSSSKDDKYCSRENMVHFLQCIASNGIFYTGSQYEAIMLNETCLKCKIGMGSVN